MEGFLQERQHINEVSLVDIAFDLSLDRDTSSGNANLIREIICEYTSENNEMLGGTNDDGTSRIVEIDESLFFKRKHNQGRIQNRQWYIGGIEIKSRKCFIVPVDNRNSITMTRIISENSLLGTKIITDKWRAYTPALRK